MNKYYVLSFLFLVGLWVVACAPTQPGATSDIEAAEEDISAELGTSGTVAGQAINIKPVVTGCQDSDGGRNYDVAGKVTVTAQNKQLEFPDKCESSSQVIEYYCQGGKMAKSVGQCATGTTCQNGACTAQQAAQETPSSQVFRCAGNVPGHAQLCAGDDSGLTQDTAVTLVAVCTNAVKCEYECFSPYTLQNGSCKVPCTDTDGGENYFVKGNTTSGSIRSEDACFRYTSLEEKATGSVPLTRSNQSCSGDLCAVREYYCVYDGTPGIRTENCLRCFEGACLR